MIAVSPTGLAYLDVKEGVVLKAYRDVVGVWTIGSGLTAGSGVVKPKAGMVITVEENRQLTQSALSRNYLPRVATALGDDISQGAIDGGASFDWNTGAIHSASWVKAFRSGSAAGVRKGLAAWVKGGGRVLPGLVTRRAEEADIILLGRYPAYLKLPTPEPTVKYAAFVISMTDPEKQKVKDALLALGYKVDAPGVFLQREGVEAFQKAYALTVDGKIGKATLSTLQRELDARTKSKAAAVTTTAATATASAEGIASAIDPTVIDVSGIPDGAALWLGGGMAALGLIYGAHLAWTYRDIIAARIATRSPRLAAILRSF